MLRLHVDDDVRAQVLAGKLQVIVGRVAAQVAPSDLFEMRVGAMLDPADRTVDGDVARVGSTRSAIREK